MRGDGGSMVCVGVQYWLFGEILELYHRQYWGIMTPTLAFLHCLAHIEKDNQQQSVSEVVLAFQYGNALCGVLISMLAHAHGKPHILTCFIHVGSYPESKAWSQSLRGLCLCRCRFHWLCQIWTRSLDRNGIACVVCRALYSPCWYWRVVVRRVAGRASRVEVWSD